MIGVLLVLVMVWHRSNGMHSLCTTWGGGKGYVVVGSVFGHEV